MSSRMNDAITIAYKGIPIPSTTHNDRGLNSRTGRVYTTKNLAEAIRLYSILVAPFRPKVPLSGAVSIELELTYPWRPKEAKKAYIRKKPKTTKPDITNLLKTIEDVLQNSGFFGNDAQVASITATKWWGDDHEIIIRIKEL